MFSQQVLYPSEGQEGSSISRQNLNEYIGSLHQARWQFYHLPGSNRKTEFLRNHPLSFFLVELNLKFILVAKEYQYYRKCYKYNSYFMNLKLNFILNVFEFLFLFLLYYECMGVYPFLSHISISALRKKLLGRLL